MNKSKIEWTNYTVNPVKGLCPVGCSYCYARRLYQRFHWDPAVRYDPDAFKGLPSKPARVFVGSTMELFGDWMDRDWMHMTFAKILARPRHTFVFLTKRPENLPTSWPANCWVGVTATDTHTTHKAFQFLAPIKATVKFISFEPLLGDVAMREGKADWFRSIQWAIIGQQTPVRKATMPKVEWVQEIALAATKANIPLFIKDNLKALLPNRMPFWCAYKWWSEDRTHQLSEWRLRQEFPQV